jgi:ribosomal protein L28
MKKDTTKERQKRWRQKRLTENKRVLTVWVSDEDMKTIEKLKKQYQEESKSSLISRVLREFDRVIYNE